MQPSTQTAPFLKFLQQVHADQLALLQQIRTLSDKLKAFTEVEQLIALQEGLASPKKELLAQVFPDVYYHAVV